MYSGVQQLMTQTAPMTPDVLLQHLVQSMVEHPDEVQVEAEENTDRIMLYLTVHRKDRGQVLGVDGETAEYIRTVLNAVGGKLRKRIFLRVKD